MRRNFNKLNQGPFDLLVIGGGITGSWAAYDAARRGLKVALIDQGDWSCGTSQSSSKMIHGGLRYLENYEFRLVQHSLHERRLLTKIGPHRIYPRRFAIPSYKTDATPPLMLRAGLILYDWLAGRDQPVARHESLNRKKFSQRYHFINPEGLRGGFTYGDCQEDDARMVLEVVAGALQYGVAAVNHAQAESLILEDQKIVGAMVKDRYNDAAEPIAVRATVTVNAAGPWAEDLLPGVRKNRITRLVKGVHLLMPALPTNDGMLVTNPEDGRVIFFIPWYGRTILGTTDSDYAGNPDDLAVIDAEIDYLLRIADRALGKNTWTREDIKGQYAGVRTLRNETEESASKLSREWELDEPRENLLMPVGGKYTSARADAAEIINRVFQRLRRDDPGCTTGVRPMPWAPLGNFSNWLQQQTERGEQLGLSTDNALWLALRFGITCEAVHQLISARPELAAAVDPELPFCYAELVHSAHAEMAENLDDLLRRRMPLTLLGNPNPEALSKLQAFANNEFGWTGQRLELNLQ